MDKILIPIGKLTEIKVRYEQGESLRKLSKELEITHVTLSKILRSVGVSIRSWREQRGRVKEAVVQLTKEIEIIEQKQDQINKANRFNILGE